MGCGGSQMKDKVEVTTRDELKEERKEAKEEDEKEAQRKREEEKNASNRPEKLTPTVVGPETFDPQSDAAVLRKATKGLGTDEQAIISVLANRTNKQLQDIRRAYKQKYEKDVVKEIEDDTSGDFQKLLVALLRGRGAHDAIMVRNAIHGVGTNEAALIETLSNRTNMELEEIMIKYEKEYTQQLTKDILSDTSFNLKQAFAAILKCKRDQAADYDEQQAIKDADTFYKAGEGRFGTDDDKFIELLTKRSYPSLRKTFQVYQEKRGKTIIEAIKNETSGDYCDLLVAIVQCIVDAASYYAERLHLAMKGIGTNDDALIGIIVSRCELDMGDIKEKYLAAYGKSLADAISDDTSGDYKKLLLALIK
eukprot:Lithocolla_globosa_v1_NODE_2622_length_1930_cov_8.440000.p1 type:complete len:365 gc:universal NODE_2622_length_1930_cov_8.440000:1131-37(-)